MARTMDRHTDGSTAQDGQSSTRRRLRIIRGASRWEPTDPDDSPTVLSLAVKRRVTFAVHSQSGKLIGRFIVRRDAVAALYFWPQVSYIISDGEIIARKAHESDEVVATARAA
jgi:hypothetical protein